MNDVVSTQPMSLGSRLCTACGICCDGSLYAKAQIYEDEDHDGFRKQGLTVFIEPDGKPWFRLPCPRFGGVCTIYNDRFQICRKFRCRLLKETEKGLHTPEAALEVIARARKLSSQARALLKEMGEQDDGKAEYLMHRCRLMLQSPPANDAPAQVRALYGRLVMVTNELGECLSGSFYDLLKDKTKEGESGAEESGVQTE